MSFVVSAASANRCPRRLPIGLGSVNRISRNRYLQYQLCQHLQHFNFLRRRGRACSPLTVQNATKGDGQSYGSDKPQGKEGEGDEEEEEEEIQLEEGEEMEEVEATLRPYPDTVFNEPPPEPIPDDEPAEFESLDVARMRIQEEVNVLDSVSDAMQNLEDGMDRYKQYEAENTESGVVPQYDEEGNLIQEDVNEEGEFLGSEQQDWTWEEMEEMQRLRMRGELEPAQFEEEEDEELPPEYDDIGEGPGADIPYDDDVDAAEEANEITPDMITGDFEATYGGEYMEDDADPRFVPQLPPLNYQMHEEDIEEMNRQIAYVESLQQLRELIIATNINLHPSHIWVMMLKVPMLVRDIINEEEREDVFAFLDDLCVMVTPLCYDIMSTDLLVGVMWTLATLGYASNSHLGKAVFQELMYEACRKIRGFDEDDVYFTFEAMAKANFNVMAPMIELSATMLEFMDEYNAQQVAGFIRNYAMLQRYNSYTFDKLVEKAYKYIEEYDVIDIIEIIWGLIFVHHFDEGLFQHAWQAIMDVEDIRYIGAGQATAMLEANANADFWNPEINERLISLFDHEGVLQHTGTDTLGVVIISWAMMRGDARRIPHIINEVYMRYMDNEAFASAIPEQVFAAYKLFKEDEAFRLMDEAEEMTEEAFQAAQVKAELQPEIQSEDVVSTQLENTENEDSETEAEKEKEKEEQEEEQEPEVISEEKEEDKTSEKKTKKSKKSKKKTDEEVEEEGDGEEQQQQQLQLQEGDEPIDDMWQEEGYDKEEEGDDDELGRYRPGPTIRVRRIKSFAEEEELEQQRTEMLQSARSEQEMMSIGKQILDDMQQEFEEVPYEDVMVDHIFPPKLILAGREAWDENEKLAVKDEEDSRRIDSICEMLMNMGFEDVQPLAYSGEETMDGTQRGIVTVDIGFQVAGQPCAIQVQGKQSFFANLITKHHGYTLLQGRLWAMSGWQVFALPWYEWDIIPGPDLKSVYLLHMMGMSPEEDQHTNGQEEMYESEEQYQQQPVPQ